MPIAPSVDPEAAWSTHGAVISNVPAEVFGRTNQALPESWLRLVVPSDHSEIDPLVAAALGSNLPIDLSVSPALWGGKMRGTDSVLSCSSSLDYAQASDSTHAIDLIQAHLIETLSCIGREYWDFYFLRFKRSVPEFALSGALEALEMMRQEGHIRFVGLAAVDEPSATLSMWRLHDAFDALLIEREEDVVRLQPLAQERRVGILAPVPVAGGVRLVSVSRADEITSCV